MKIKHIFFAITLCLLVIGCKKEVKQEMKEEKVALAISGMTCEIGCAKTIQSKLSKKEGVLNAKVVFSDSIATINYDANKTSKEDLIAFVDGIAGGELYKASEAKNEAKSKSNCDEECMKKCESSKEKNDCCAKDKEGNHICKKDAKHSCCKEVV